MKNNLAVPQVCGMPGERLISAPFFVFFEKMLYLSQKISMSIYSQEIADEICEIIATTSKSLRKICKDERLPSVSTVLKWVRENENNFQKQYARAKQEQAEFMAEEILEISDDSSDDLLGIDEHGNKIENREFINRSKLRVDTRKWLMSKLLPKKYGDKIDIDMTTKCTPILPVDLTIKNKDDETN